MANETTASSLTELIQSEWISPLIQTYAGHYRNPSQFFRRMDPQNGATTVAQPRIVSDEGTPTDAGAGVDIEYNATEATDLSNVEFETTESTFSISEYGIARELSKTAQEDVPVDIVTTIIQDAARILGTAFNDDGCALFAGFTGSSGATTVDLSVADVDDALYDLAERGVMGTLVGILDNQAMRDFLNALQAVGSNDAVYPNTADRMMGVMTSEDQGRNVEGLTVVYKGVPFYRTGLTDTANTGADVVSCIFVRGDAEENALYAAIGQGYRREFTLETDYKPRKRTTEIIATQRAGCGRLHPDAGQKLISDAP